MIIAFEIALMCARSPNSFVDLFMGTGSFLLHVFSSWAWLSHCAFEISPYRRVSNIAGKLNKTMRAVRVGENPDRRISERKSMINLISSDDHEF